MVTTVGVLLHKSNYIFTITIRVIKSMSVTFTNIIVITITRAVTITIVMTVAVTIAIQFQKYALELPWQL